MFQWLRERLEARARAESAALEMIERLGAEAAFAAARLKTREANLAGKPDREATAVLRAVERLTGQSHQADTATRYLED